MRLKKKYMFPLIYVVVELISLAFHLDGMFMLISLPAILMIAVIDGIFGILIKSVLLSHIIALVFWFLFGCMVDQILKKINEPFKNPD